tara:strand:+ start:789 stop:1157 length:369 start_codon:yes stop_codon:yes gene_type:complete
VTSKTPAGAEKPQQVFYLFSKISPPNPPFVADLVYALGAVNGTASLTKEPQMKIAAKKIQSGEYLYKGFYIRRVNTVGFAGDICSYPWNFEDPRSGEMEPAASLKSAKAEIDFSITKQRSLK